MTKNFYAPLALVGAALFSTAALAATLSKTGEVKSTDITKHELVLSNGDTFELGSNIKIDKLKVGEKVAITYEMKDGKMLASKVQSAK